MDTCLECLVLADLHNAEELKDAAVKFVVDHSEEFVDQVKIIKIKDANSLLEYCSFLDYLSWIFNDEG